MDNHDSDFEEWYETLIMLLHEQSVSFRDKSAVRDDFEKGRDVFDVCDEIKAEYE